MNPKVIISHPSRQHSHQTAFALQEGGMLEEYIVPLWYKPAQFPYSMLGFRPFKTEFLKRHFAPLQDNLITQIPQYEIVRRVSHALAKTECMKHIYWMNERFDSNVAARLRSAMFDLFVGGETAALHSFRVCKERGKIAILDLAQSHYSSHHVLEDSGLDPFNGSRALQKRIEAIKEEEIALADLILTPSTVARKTLTDFGISENKIVTIPYGYDSDLFVCKPSYRKSGVFRILFVGAVTKRKGVQNILRVFSELNLKNAELIFAGGKADASPLISANGSIRYAGFVNPVALKHFYGDADLFVMPSLLDSFGLVVLEAMACGTPVIVSEMTGAKDVVRRGVDGFVIAPMDVEALKERILHLYNNRERVEQMGREASVQAKKFTWEHYREKIREAILEVSGRDARTTTRTTK